MCASVDRKPRPRVAEFFAGVGLVRHALERTGFEVVWANDIDSRKEAVYAANFGRQHFVRADINDASLVRGCDIPEVDLATASFPCTDLSLAGNRDGLQGRESGAFWGFSRVIEEMVRRPQAILIENVPGFATSNNGQDLLIALQELNRLGYVCDLVVIDARRFLPQSRERLFIVGSQSRYGWRLDWGPSDVRPRWIKQFAAEHPELMLQAHPLDLPTTTEVTLEDLVDRLPSRHSRWWEPERVERFVSSLSKIQGNRLRELIGAATATYRTAFRRTRSGRATWEIRADEIAGCLRATRGGSSKQAVIEAGRGEFRVRWMTGSEYAKLQGAEALQFDAVSENQAMFALGDAVCVPAVQWLAQHYLLPLLTTQTEPVLDLAGA